MRRIVLGVLFVQLILAVCIVYPAFADATAVVVVQPEPAVVQPPPVVVQPPPVVVQQPPVVVQQPPVVVQPPAVVVQPYAVVEGGVTIQIDPEDYYYQDKEVYYHHNYQSAKDVVVKTVPSEYRFVRSRIDISKVPRKHFRHPITVEKTETTKTQVAPISGTETVETTTTVTK
jgi:hypothetical protein